VIDHVSIPVNSLAVAGEFFEAVLAPLGYARLVDEPSRIGFGKRYPELWLNERPGLKPLDPRDGHHVCLRAGSAAEVDRFHTIALARGGVDEGAPGLRRYSKAEVYAAFIRDPDGNRLEAMTIVSGL
jgi:catechol 2,3-dioxygenase-like lactoylglutathione lyase family enzyme